MKSSVSLFLAIIFLIFLPAQLFSDTKATQLLMPKIIYTGDLVEIKYIFKNDSKILSADFQNQMVVKQDIKNDCGFFNLYREDFTVCQSSLEKINSEYTLSISLIPWKTGNIIIKPFDLNLLLEKSGIPYFVALSPIEVNSLAKKNGVSDFLPPSPPQTLPGTTFFLILLGIFAFFLISLGLFVLIRFPKISFFLTNLLYLWSLKRISRKSIKKLVFLQENSSKFPSDKDYAGQIQQLLRSFLSKRFARDFSSVTTGKIPPLFNEICAGDINEKQEEGLEKLVSIFSRIDFIRFAENGAFNPGERGRIIQDSISLIGDFNDDSI